MDKERRARFELYRTIALLSDYFDKSTRFMLFGILGSVLIAVPISMYISIVFEAPSPLIELVVPITIAYMGFAFLLYANRYRRQSKKTLDNYMDMIQKDSLISDPEYQKLVSAVRNEIRHSIETTIEKPRVFPSKGEIIRRNVRLEHIRRNIDGAEHRKQELFVQTKTLEMTVAMLERRVYDLTRESHALSKKHAKGE